MSAYSHRACSHRACKQPTRRAFGLGLAASGLFGKVALAQTPAPAKPIPVVATFSILADFVQEIGGERVKVFQLVGPNGDAHVYEAAPADVGKIAAAGLIVENGLGLEGWMSRLIQASGAKAPVVVASQGVAPRRDAGEKDGVDPHAWQSIANAKIYVANIAKALAAADPGGAAEFFEREKIYDAKLDALDAEIRAAVAKIPPERRRIVTTHDAFGYFGQDYGLAFIAPAGVSSEGEISARNLSAIIRQIKAEKIPAVFLENISDPRLMQRIAQESGAKIGGALYSDALSPPDGPAATYLAMMHSNIDELTKALTL